MPSACCSYCRKFLALFPDRDACYRHLARIKAEQGYCCLKCSHPVSGRGRTQYHRRCQSCGYDESPLCRTFFAGMHFPIQKAFYLLYKMRTSRRWQSTLQLAQLLSMQPKTVRRFREQYRQKNWQPLATDAHNGETYFLSGILD